jgi:hypothetical protein
MNPFAANKSAIELVAQAHQLVASLQASGARAKAAAELSIASWVAGQTRLRAAEFTALVDAIHKTPA